jgi:hypothetical protein
MILYQLLVWYRIYKTDIIENYELVGILVKTVVAYFKILCQNMCFAFYPLYSSKTEIHFPDNGEVQRCSL